MDSATVPDRPGEIRAVLIVRNEALRLPQILDHHRSLGVDRFFAVDNDSNDGTLDLLLGQPDTHVFFTDRSFRDEKALWRRRILEEFCEDHWTLHVDADELLLYPECDSMGLRTLCSFLEEEGAKGMFAPLVDMYPGLSLEETTYRPGASLVATCPYFDSSGYHLRYRRKQAAPPFRLQGGPRARLMYERAEKPPRLRRALADWLYDIRRTRPALALRIPLLAALLDAAAKSGLPRRAPPMGKVPLLRWSREIHARTRCLDGLHYVKPPVPLSSSWGALLHFKFLGDFRERVREAVEKKLYGGADFDYERYEKFLQIQGSVHLKSGCSRRFDSTRDLLDAGLMRRSDGLASFARRVAAETATPSAP
jgi:hypothetical protein